jgi:hypothetical protein
MTARCSRSPAQSYFVLMIDYGNAREAVVNPEFTRSNIIDMIKDPKCGRVDFVHHIEDGLVEDVTHEIIDAAEGELRAEEFNRSERISYKRDHERALRVAS